MRIKSGLDRSRKKLKRRSLFPTRRRDRRRRQARIKRVAQPQRPTRRRTIRRNLGAKGVIRQVELVRQALEEFGVVGLDLGNRARMI